MAKPRKKLLPKDFDQLLKSRELADLQAIFNTCDLNARGGHAKQTALAFDDCPDELARWLVAQGADLSAADTWGNTPLHARSRSLWGRIGVLLELGADVNGSAPIGTPLHAAAASYNVTNARLLLDHGAPPDGHNREGMTPLELALSRCSNIDLERMAPLAELLLAAGATRTPPMTTYVETVGKRFEFHRSGFDPDSVDAASDALHRLYEMFDVTPEPRRVMHDGKARILVIAGTLAEQHQALWASLVPSSGHAATVQGELIRASGRIADELDGNGGINWDDDYCRMADAFIDNLQQGDPLPPASIAEARAFIAQIKRKSGDPGRLAQLAVSWVQRNPVPIALAKPDYRR